MKKVLIVPGLGDHTGYIKRATKHWPRKYDIEPHVYVFGWSGDVSEYDIKYQRFLKEIQSLSKDGPISLIGISAGGSLVANAVLDLPKNVDKVVNICGRLRNGKRGLWAFRSFPLHWKCVDYLEQRDSSALKLLTIRPLFDEAVPTSVVTAEGAKNIRVLSILHIPSIIWILYRKDRLIREYISS